MLKIKVSTKESAEVTQISHFRESDLINIVEEDGLVFISLKNPHTDDVVFLYTREPIELSEYSSLIEVKEKTIVEHRNTAGFVGNRQFNEAVIDKENKELRFRLTDVIDELKQRLDKLENK